MLVFELYVDCIENGEELKIWIGCLDNDVIIDESICFDTINEAVEHIEKELLLFAKNLVNSIQEAKIERSKESRWQQKNYKSMKFRANSTSNLMVSSILNYLLIIILKIN